MKTKQFSNLLNFCIVEYLAFFPEQYTSYQEQVKALIDAGNTDSVTTNSDACGNSSTSYYEEFEYSGYRVLITSGVPSHEAEENLLIADGGFNPNRRCKCKKVKAKQYH